MDGDAPGVQKRELIGMGVVKIDVYIVEVRI
jgi:hypothetical protein